MDCNKYRHVCLADLENYIRKDSYFADFTDEELAIIRKNLGIDNQGDNSIVEGTYESIYNIAVNKGLDLHTTYIINNFRTLYYENNRVCGTDDYIPSMEYHIILTPSSSSTFDKRVSLFSIEDKDASGYIVEYDITPQTFLSGSTDMGRITYLRDQKNNSAYFDFKNKKILVSKIKLNEAGLSYTEDTWFRTFNNNLSRNCTLGPECTGNVFLNAAINVSLGAECKYNLFCSRITDCTFNTGTNNNIFKSFTQACKGAVSDKIISDVASTAITKYFDESSGDCVIIYFDHDTQTYQVTKL